MPSLEADYSVLTTAPGFVWIEDLNLGNRSVTNDAERVCRLVNALHSGSRIIYRDSAGQWDEMEHKDGAFLRFMPAPGFAL